MEDSRGKKVATLFGKWDESMYFVNGEGNSKPKDMYNASLLWKKNMPPANLTRYNLTSFAITLNELTPGLKVYVVTQISYMHFRFFLCISNCVL